ncbi:MICOS complex subunit MIC12 [Monosporozyma servazzii]
MALSNVLLKTALPAMVATSCYVYAMQDDGHYYNQSYYKRVNDEVNAILSHQHDSPRNKYSILWHNSQQQQQQLLVLNRTELYKDIWNQQVYKLWNYLNDI